MKQALTLVLTIVVAIILAEVVKTKLLKMA